LRQLRRKKSDDLLADRYASWRAKGKTAELTAEQVQQLAAPEESSESA
jgi:hypothetical protein